MSRTPTRRLVPAVATAATAALLAASLATTASAASTLAVSGRVAGSYSASSSNADAGQSYQLYRGKGTTSLGSTTSSGKGHGLGFVNQAYCSMSALLVTSRGKVSVRIRSKTTEPGGFSCKSFAFTWRSVSSSGSYAGKSGSGTGSVTMSKTDSTGHGTFALTFDK
jgi:hypothetical protein